MKYEEVVINSEKWLSLNDLLNEIWKDIKDFKGLYQISNYGRVKSLGNKSNHKREKILKANLSNKNYYKICLNKNNIRKTFTVHRLVAETFIENVFLKKEINHIDGNKHNNRIDNLEWVTRKENQIHAYKNKLQIAKKNNERSFPIYQLNLDGKIINKFPSIMEAERKTGIKNANIARACKRNQTTCGYKWRYINEPKA